MYRKNPIDLSHAHLVPERIKQYALNIFDEVEKYPKVNSEMQRLFILLTRAENILKQAPLVSDYFAATRKNNLYYEGLKALIDGDDKWYEKRKANLYDHSDKLQTYIDFNFNFIFHFFLTYYLRKNNLTL